MKRTTAKTIARGMLNFELIFDDEKRKLYDKFKNRELSHNRKYKLLKQIYNYFQNEKKYGFVDEIYKNKIIEKIEQELNNIGRMNWGYYK